MTSAPSAFQQLKPQHQDFVMEYLTDLNGTRAAIRAGFARNSAHVTAHRLLARNDVQAAIAEQRASLADRYRVTVDRVVGEMALTAFARMEDYVAFGKDGHARVDLSGVTSAQSAAIGEVISEEFMDGRGEDARPVRRTKIKLNDKHKALDSLGKHLGMFVEQHDHRVMLYSDFMKQFDGDEN